MSDTQVKFNKTSCYFCNEWLENEQFLNHVSQCEKVLEKCPNKCISYVPRKLMNQHITECPKLGLRPKADDDNSFQMTVLEQEIESIRKALNEEIKQRLTLVTEIGNLKKRHQIGEEWVTKVGDVLATLKKCINEETASRYQDINKCREDISKLLMRHDFLDEWRVEISMRLDNIQTEVIYGDNFQAQMDALINNNTVSILKIERFEAEINKLSQQNFDSENTSKYVEKLKAVDQIFDDQQRLIKSVQNYLSTELNNVKDEILQLKVMFEGISEKIEKQNSMNFEMKTIKNIVYETEDKCDKFDKTVKEIKGTADQTQQDMANLEVHLVYQEKLLPIHNMRGRLLWKIGDFSNKMLESKEKDITLRSPIFCTKQYGYNLRLDVHLNGVGTWKGRNIIACLTIAPGDYDTLLVWPCKIEAEVILRDQSPNLQDAQDIKKMLIAKRKHETLESNNSSIHISHKILETNHYKRDDAIFFEVKVRSSN